MQNIDDQSGVCLSASKLAHSLLQVAKSYVKRCRAEDQTSLKDPPTREPFVLIVWIYKK